MLVIPCECGDCLKKALKLACQDMELMMQADLGHRSNLAEDLYDQYVNEANNA